MEDRTPEQDARAQELLRRARHLYEETRQGVDS
jgi:hypothetical protein